MNFIDKALIDIDKLSADDFLQIMGNIFSEPIERVDIKRYPQFVQDLIFIIDYDTELQMEGLVGFFNDSTKEYVNETITALRNCGAINDASILEECMYLGEKDYDRFVYLETKTYIYNDFDGFWELIINYIESEKNLLVK